MDHHAPASRCRLAWTPSLIKPSGLWTLTAEDADTTRVQYDWRVKTEKAWMNLLAPLAKPFSNGITTAL